MIRFLPDILQDDQVSSRHSERYIIYLYLSARYYPISIYLHGIYPYLFLSTTYQSLPPSISYVSIQNFIYLLCIFPLSLSIYSVSLLLSLSICFVSPPSLMFYCPHCSEFLMVSLVSCKGQHKIFRMRVYTSVYRLYRPGSRKLIPHSPFNTQQSIQYTHYTTFKGTISHDLIKLIFYLVSPPSSK